MKKAAILSIAAFYLLLTTGMYVCILHCTVVYFVRPATAMHDKDCEAHKGKEHTPCKNGCDCCKKHGTYVIKENIKPASDFQPQQVAVISSYPVGSNFIREYPTTAILAWQDNNAPPGSTGKSISIKLHSLQI
jgi:hypothetical protein